MSVKKSIGWCDMTLNPLKGRCRGGCWYCYYSGKRGMLNRFKIDPEILIELAVFDSLFPGKPKKIFLCSTHDLFGSWIPHHWRDMIFREIIEHPQHAFQILTKFPQNIDREMPDNVWLGVTVTKSDDKGWMNLYYLKQAKAKLKFVSFEPLLGMLNTPMIINSSEFDWFIFGRLTGYGSKYDPDKRWITPLVNYFKGYKKPIFLKDNLKEIWGEKLIQEFPK